MSKIHYILHAFVLTALLSTGGLAHAGHNFAGQSCPRGITDPLKCMVCVLYFEAHPDNYKGMLEVGRVVMERTESRSYPNNICRVAYQAGQFVALPTNRKMSNDASIMAKVVKAAKAAMEVGGNNFLGFRTCSGGRNEVGGNCFRRTGDASDYLLGDYQIQSATLYNSEANAIRTVDALLSEPADSPPTAAERETSI